MTMQAVVLKSKGHLELTEIPRPVCPPEGVLIRVSACGICTADLKMIARGHRALVYPRIPGHEIVGVVAQSRSRGIAVGTRVQVAPGLRCGTCAVCRRGADNQCSRREILGFTRHGGFAQYLALPLAGAIRGAVQPLPDGLPFAAATLAEPLACCINAQERIGIGPGDRVLIMGGGTLGLLHTALARRRGADTIVVAEPIDTRRRRALELGADATMDPARGELRAVLAAATGDGQVDVLILACSQVSLDPGLTAFLAPGARVSLFSGMPAGDAVLGLDANQIHYHEFILTGSYGCTAGHNRQAVSLLSDGIVPPETIITGRTSLENLIDSLAGIPAGVTAKTIMEVKNE